MLTFKQFQKISKQRNNAACAYTAGWTLGDWGCALAGEAGELCNYIKKLNRPTGNKEKIKAEAEKELADIISYTFLLASVMGVDLETVVRNKFNEVSDRWDCPIKLKERD